MDFQNEVLKKSKKVPVVVDFWAPWCGPCQFLGPVIEELAREANGKWELIKVNTDENPSVSGEYSIRGIPAVKMFYDGKVVAEFTGALPRHQILRWLEENIPDDRKKELSEILKLYQTDTAKGLTKLKSFVDDNPDIQEARVGLARRLVFSEATEAALLIEDIKPGNRYYETAQHIHVLRELAQCDHNDNPTQAEKLVQAQKGLKENDLDKTLKALIEGVMIDKKFCDELPRKSTIAIFNLLGPDHELTKKYRRKFDMALY